MSLSDAISTFEKGHYPFAAYPQKPCKSVLFPGCSMTSQFPRTTDALVRVCRGMGMGVVYDCCATSVAAQGKGELACRVLGRIRARLEAIGCTEVVLACPNCYAHMAGRLGIRCVSIYEKLLQWQEGPQSERLAKLVGLRYGPRDHAPVFRQRSQSGRLAEPVVRECVTAQARPRGVLFTPCPDREKRIWESQARMLLDMGEVQTLRGVPCCGLKPELASKGKAAVQALDEAIFAKAAGRTIYTTCASCAGQFARMGYAGGVRHVLGAILGMDEAPDCAHAILNRARRRFDRDLEPLEEL